MKKILKQTGSKIDRLTEGAWMSTAIPASEAEFKPQKEIVLVKKIKPGRLAIFIARFIARIGVSQVCKLVLLQKPLSIFTLDAFWSVSCL